MKLKSLREIREKDDCYDDIVSSMDSLFDGRDHKVLECDEDEEHGWLDIHFEGQIMSWCIKKSWIDNHSNFSYNEEVDRLIQEAIECL